jgi:Hemerythrin HHE cation binding domain
MSDVNTSLPAADTLPDNDVIRLLLEQHSRIKQLFAETKAAVGEDRQTSFDALRALLAVHETAEEMILRPTTKKTAGSDVVEARNHEEYEANKVLKGLESMDVQSPDFLAHLEEFEQAVLQHADAEESEEFPTVLAQCDEDDRQTMGRHLIAAESGAPTHPHPSTAGSTVAQWAVGPFASMVDRVRDGLKRAMQ